MSADPVKLASAEPPKLSLLGLPAESLIELFESLGEKPYRARQVMRWLYGRGVVDFGAMTDLSTGLRKQLAGLATADLPRVLKCEHSADGTRKWLLDMNAGQAIETVFIPEPSRGTLCISSQAGCALDCAFCATGHQGFNRNLSAAEILGQVVLASRELGEAKITNVVFMGMGEPLANYRNVLPVVKLLIDDLGYGLSRRRVTISTSGLVPQIERLATECNARRLAACAQRRLAQRARADQPRPSDRGAARRVLEVRRGPGEPADHLRVRAARRGQRLGARGAAAREAAA